jgi:hypothetical protein
VYLLKISSENLNITKKIIKRWFIISLTFGKKYLRLSL